MQHYKHLVTVFADHFLSHNAANVLLYDSVWSTRADKICVVFMIHLSMLVQQYFTWWSKQGLVDLSKFFVSKTRVASVSVKLYK